MWDEAISKVLTTALRTLQRTPPDEPMMRTPAPLESTTPRATTPKTTTPEATTPGAKVPPKPPGDNKTTDATTPKANPGTDPGAKGTPDKPTKVPDKTDKAVEQPDKAAQAKAVPDKPDLTISKVTFKPERPKVGEAIQPVIYYKNSGGKTADNFHLRLADNPVGTAGYGLGNTPLAPGEEKEHLWGALRAAKAGTFTLEFSVDPYNKVDEADENNNSLTVTLEIAAP